MNKNTKRTRPWTYQDLAEEVERILGWRYPTNHLFAVHRGYTVYKELRLIIDIAVNHLEAGATA